jgi:hypothetical protein
LFIASAVVVVHRTFRKLNPRLPNRPPKASALVLKLLQKLNVNAAKRTVALPLLS